MGVAFCPHHTVLFLVGNQPGAWAGAMLLCLNCAGVRPLPGELWCIPVEVGV